MGESAGRLLLVFSLIAVLPAGETLRIVDCDAMARADLPFRCGVQATIPATAARGDLVLRVLIDQGGSTIAEQTLSLDNLGQIHAGVVLVLVPAPAHPRDAEQAATLRASLAAGGRLIADAVADLETPGRVRARLDHAWQRLQAGRDPAALPRLWAEQGAALYQGPETLHALARLGVLTAQLDAWVDGRHPAPVPGVSFCGALRDPGDGSVQPWRLHLPMATGDVAVAVVLADHRQGAPTKSAWPELPAAWLLAARERAVAVVECYPAGDVGWDGVALRRVETALAAVRASLAGLPVRLSTRPALIGIGSGAAGVIRLAERRPEAWSALALVRPVLPAVVPTFDPVAGWLRQRAAVGERLAHVEGLALAAIGTGNPVAAAWLERAAAAYGVNHGLPEPASAGFWNWLIAAAASRSAADPGERVVLEPGSYAAVTVERLASWGVAGSLLWSADRRVLRTVGIADLNITSPPPGLVVDGTSWTGPRRGRTSRPAKVLGQACGPLAAYADGRFVVVVGTAEHAAARADNLVLAQSFVHAWVAHAQGQPPLLLDQAITDPAYPARSWPVFAPADWPGHHLVLIGNARSNAVLRRLAADGVKLPLTWDERRLYADGVQPMRAEHRAVALAWPHPAADGRLLIVLDGAVSWRADGSLPLAGLPDLVVGGERGQPPAVWRLFGNDWK